MGDWFFFKLCQKRSLENWIFYSFWSAWAKLLWLSYTIKSWLPLNSPALSSNFSAVPQNPIISHVRVGHRHNCLMLSGPYVGISMGRHCVQTTKLPSGHEQFAIQNGGFMQGLFWWPRLLVKRIVQNINFHNDSNKLQNTAHFPFLWSFHCDFFQAGTR